MVLLSDFGPRATDVSAPAQTRIGLRSARPAPVTLAGNRQRPGPHRGRTRPSVAREPPRSRQLGWPHKTHDSGRGRPSGSGTARTRCRRARAERRRRTIAGTPVTCAGATVRQVPGGSTSDPLTNGETDRHVQHDQRCNQRDRPRGLRREKEQRDEQCGEYQSRNSARGESRSARRSVILLPGRVVAQRLPLVVIVHDAPPLGASTPADVSINLNFYRTTIYRRTIFG